MTFQWLRFWKRRPRRADLHVRMYTRAGCHLCEEAWNALQQAQEKWGFRLDAVDVDTDPALAKLHGDWVPVVTVDDKVRFRGGVNAVLLKRLLERECE